MAISFILAALAVVPIHDDPVADRAAGRSHAKRTGNPPAD